jgi:hypothetical protein
MLGSLRLTAAGFLQKRIENFQIPLALPFQMCNNTAIGIPPI